MPIAPGCRATSRPSLNSTSVGMLRIANRLPSAGSASVSTLPRRMPGSSRDAACSNCGAIVLQGPHQGAQKSTSSGMSLRASWRSKLALVSATGLPVNSGW